MITISIGKADTTCVDKITLTSGMVKAVQVAFDFTDEWEGFDKVAVFSNGEISVDVSIDDTGRCYIPHEILATHGKEITCGIYGSKGVGKDYRAIPTAKCSLGKVVEGVNPAGEEPTEPTPNIWDELRIRVENLENNGSDGVPDCVKAEAKQVARKVFDKKTLSSLVLFMATDIHKDNSENAEKAIEHLGMGMEEVQGYVTPNAVVLLGDYNYAYTPLNKENGIDDMLFVRKALSNATKNVPAIWMNGNHDNYKYSSEHTLSNDTIYKLVGSNTTANVVVNENDVLGNYGYIDFEKEKIRLIYLNTDDGSTNVIGTTQGQWLIDVLLDISNKADEEEWGVVICTHYPPQTLAQLPTILGKFKDRTSGRSHSKDYDFTNSKAELIGCFHGHIHNFKVTDIETEGGNVVKAICIPNAYPDRNNPYGDNDETNGAYDEKWADLDASGNPVIYPKTPDTAEDTSFNAVVIDKDSKTIHAICYGAGVDREIQYDVAKEEPEVEIINQISISTDASGAIYGEDYNGDGVKDGYKDGVRLGSDGADRTGAPTDATGFIPITVGDILYFKNCQVAQTGTGTDDYNVICCYKGDKSRVGTLYLFNDISANYTYTKDENNNLTMFDTSKLNPATEFVRIVGNYIGADSIITKNQPIE